MSFTEKCSPYFTESVLRDILKTENNVQDVEIEKITPGLSSKKGDSYLSNICRFTVHYRVKTFSGTSELQSLHVIVKYLLENIGRRKTFRSPDFFENESIFYKQVWPALEGFQTSKNVKSFQNIPKLLSAHIDGTSDYMAFIDLSFEHFRNANRGDGLDRAHTILILRLFAQFHALSLAFKDQQPLEFEEVASKLKETYFHPKFRNWYELFQNNLVAIVRDAVNKELPSEYLNKLDSLLSRGDFYARICELCENKSKFSVVTHGDAWIPNFLIKYKDCGNEPLEAVMIDFQLARYASLSNDIIFFLYSCVQPEILMQSWDEFITLYHESLCQTLEKYGSNKNLISMEELQEDIGKSIVFGIGMSMEALTMSLLDDEDVSDLDCITGDEAVPLEKVWIVQPFKEQKKRTRIASMIKHAVDKKYI